MVIPYLDGMTLDETYREDSPNDHPEVIIDILDAF